jgi:hypothetical protein
VLDEEMMPVVNVAGGRVVLPVRGPLRPKRSPDPLDPAGRSGPFAYAQ